MALTRGEPGPPPNAKEGSAASAGAEGVPELLHELAGLEMLPSTTREVLLESAQKLESTTVYVAVVGDFKRGKSSLINALLEVQLVPTGVVPLTAQPTLIRYGEEPLARVVLEAGTERLPVDQIRRYVTEKENPENVRKVQELWVEYPSPLLRAGIVVVDTPGTGSSHRHNTATAQAFLPRIDVAIAVLTAESPLSLSEASWLAEVAQRASRLAVCLNKVDAISRADREEALDYIRRGLSPILGELPYRLFCTSARRELEQGGDEGVGKLRAWLSGEVAEARADLALLGAATVGRSAVEVGRGLLALERAALAAPLEDAARREGRVHEASRRLDRAGREGRALIAAQAKELVRTRIEPELDRLRPELAGRLQALDDEGWAGELELTAAREARELQELARVPLEEALNEQAGRLQEVLERFLDEVSSLYQVALGPTPRLADPARLPRVRVTTTDEAGALAMGVRVMRGALPGAVGRRWRERSREREALEAADRLCGRLRFAAVAAVEQAAREWLVWSDAQWRGLHDALTAALERGATVRDEGLATAESQRARLAGVEALLERASDQLGPPAAH